MTRRWRLQLAGGILLMSACSAADEPCPGTCMVPVTRTALPAESQVDVDADTGAMVVRLTTDPAVDSFAYYEPSAFSPDDTRLLIATTRFRDDDGPVLVTPAVVDLASHEITAYRSDYAVEWAEWSRDGRYIYGVGRHRNRDFEPYFVAIDTELAQARVLALEYGPDQLPPGFDEAIYSVPEGQEGSWRRRGDRRVPEQGFFFHLNPSGTLGAFEAYGALGVVDIASWSTWIAGTGANRGSFYDDERVAFGQRPPPPGGVVERTVNVRTGQVELPEVTSDAFYQAMDCNHGNVRFEDGVLAEVACPSPHPTRAGEYAFFVYDLAERSVSILAETPDPECCGIASGFSGDGARVLGLADGDRIVVYDRLAGTRAAPFSGRFGGQFLRPMGVFEWTSSYGGQTMLSHDGARVAFMGHLYATEDELEEDLALRPECDNEKGPGGCDTPEACDAFCAEHPLECAEFGRRQAELAETCAAMARVATDVFLIQVPDELFGLR